MSKITRTTIKSFIKKNRGNLHVISRSSFDGMVDCVMPNHEASIKPAEVTEDHYENTLGIKGAWFVGSSRDYFSPVQHDGFTGYEVYNCCGSFELLIPEVS